MNTSTNRLEEIKRIGSCVGSGAALFCVRREPEPGLLTYCPKVDTKIQKIPLGATFRVVLTPLPRHGTIIKIICERVNCAMVSIREGLSCCDKTHGAVFLPTLYQVLLFDFSSFGEKLFFCLRGYRRAIARKKTAGAQSEDVPLFTRRRTGGEWVEVATLPHHQQAIAAQSREARCKNSRSAERGCSSVHPPPNRRRMGGGNLATTNRLSPRNRAKRQCKTAGAQSEDVPLFTRRRTGGEWVE